MTQNPLVSRFSKKLVGMAPQRTMPIVAKESFKAWFKKHPSVNNAGKKVMLWPDTFTNYFNPAIGKAAVAVLETLGYQVIVPSVHLCCGRPLYDYGFLKTAKQTLLKILSALRSEIRAGIPLIGLEPSCIAVFRDELKNLLPKDEDARRLAKQSFMLGEFLAVEQKDYPWPQLSGKALVQAHCHHKAVMGFDSEQALLKQLGLDLTVMDAGVLRDGGKLWLSSGRALRCIG